MAGTVDLIAGQGNLPMYRIRNRFGEANVYTNGAHLAGYIPANQNPVLWMSRRSAFVAGKPLRGGSPICFPQFGRPSMKMPLHGIVRTRDWRHFSNVHKKDGSTELSLQFEADDETRAVFDAEFRLLYTVSVGLQLQQNLLVHNSGSTTLTVDAMLHNYYAIGDVRQAIVSGLAGEAYLDKVTGSLLVDENHELRFTGQTDRLYRNAARNLILTDQAWQRQIAVIKTGCALSTAVWNPWEEKAQQLAANPGDFGQDEWPEMVCLEVGAAGRDAIIIPAGQTRSIGAITSVSSL